MGVSVHVWVSETTGIRESMPPYRVIVATGRRTTSLVVPLDHAPRLGETVELPYGTVTVLHVISATRDGFAGIVMCEAA